jgi:hypothetical protein
MDTIAIEARGGSKNCLGKLHERRNSALEDIKAERLNQDLSLESIKKKDPQGPLEFMIEKMFRLIRKIIKEFKVFLTEPA